VTGIQSLSSRPGPGPAAELATNPNAEAGLGGGSTEKSAPEAAAAPPATPRTARPSPVAGGGPAVAVLAGLSAGPGGVAVA